MITRKNAGWWLVGLVFAFAIAPVAGKVILVIVAVAAYLISLRLHPHRDCRSCGGSGRHDGLVFGFAQRRCGSCGGVPRHRRWGNQILSPGKLTRAERRAGLAMDRRGRPLP